MDIENGTGLSDGDGVDGAVMVDAMMGTMGDELRHMSPESAGKIGHAGSLILELCDLYDEIAAGEGECHPRIQESADVAATLVGGAVGYLAVVGHFRGFDVGEVGRIVPKLLQAASIIDGGQDDSPGSLPGAVASLRDFLANREVARIADAVVGFARVAAVADVVYEDHGPRLRRDASALCRWLAEAVEGRALDEDDVLSYARRQIDRTERLLRQFGKHGADRASAEVQPYTIDASRRIEALGVLGEDANLAVQIRLDGVAVLSQIRDVLSGAIERDPSALPPAAASAALACCAVAEGMARMLRYEGPTLMRTAAILRRSATVVGTPDEMDGDIAEVLDRAIDSCDSEIVVDVAKCAIALVGIAGPKMSDGHRDRLVRLLSASADAIHGLTMIDPNSIDGPEAAGRVWAHLPDDVFDGLAWRVTPEWTAAFVRSAHDAYRDVVLARLAFANARANEVAERF